MVGRGEVRLIVIKPRRTNQKSDLSSSHQGSSVGSYLPSVVHFAGLKGELGDQGDTGSPGFTGTKGPHGSKGVLNSRGLCRTQKLYLLSNQM